MKCAVLRCRSVLPWRLSRMPLEKAHEMLRIVKAERLAHLSDAQRKVVEQLLGIGEQAAGNELFGRLARLHAHQFAEIAARKAASLGKICHRGQPFAAGFRFDVVFEQCLKLCDHGVVDFLARSRTGSRRNTGNN